MTIHLLKRGSAWRKTCNHACYIILSSTASSDRLCILFSNHIFHSAVSEKSKLSCAQILASEIVMSKNVVICPPIYTG